MGYITPADVDVSDDRDAHLARDSAEPGTDYKTPYGTDLRAPGHGRVIGVDHSNDGPEGRRLTFLMDNGEVIDWIHLSKILASPNDRIEPGEQSVALSGASGFGKDRHYASHLHVTRRARLGLPYRQTLDFEAAIGGQSATVPATNTPITALLGSENEMIWIARVNKAYYLVVPQGAGKPRAVQLGGVGYQPAEPYAKIPQINFEDDWSIEKLKAAVDGI